MGVGETRRFQLETTVYYVLTSIPPELAVALVGLLVTLVVHQLAHGRKSWSYATGFIFSLLIGFVTHSLGLGWWLTRYFGSPLIAVAAYFMMGFVWLAIEAVIDFRNVVLRYREFARDWCFSQGLGDWDTMSAAERDAANSRLLPELEAQQRRTADPVIFPRRYYKSKDRRVWFLGWFLFWPLYFVDATLHILVIDPWKWLRHLLPTYVRFVVGLFTPADIPQDPRKGPETDGGRPDRRHPDHGPGAGGRPDPGGDLRYVGDENNLSGSPFTHPLDRIQ
jgi:hypothetical protein